MLGKQSNAKYKAEDCPTLKECFDLLDKSVQPTVERLQLLRWMFSDLCAGNDDSHAKNLSIIAASGGLCLAPVL